MWQKLLYIEKYTGLPQTPTLKIKLPKHSNVSGGKSSSETYTQCIVLIDCSIKWFHQRTDCAKFGENHELDPKITTAIMIQ